MTIIGPIMVRWMQGDHYSVRVCSSDVTEEPAPEKAEARRDPDLSLSGEAPHWVQTIAASAMQMAGSVRDFAAALNVTALTRAVATAVQDSLASDSQRRILAKSAWYEKKRQRAELHKATSAASSKAKGSAAEPLTRTAHVQCGRAQPGSIHSMRQPFCFAASRSGMCKQPQHQL